VQNKNLKVTIKPVDGESSIEESIDKRNLLALFVKH